MPEGDTIHQLARALQPELCGQILLEARVAGQPTRLVGRPIGEVEAIGKHLLIYVDQLVLRSHLGMYGSWHRYHDGERWQRPKWQASVVLRTAQRIYVCFRAEEVELLDRRGGRFREWARGLGPDILGDGFDPTEVKARIRERCRPGEPMCDVLLDQRLAAGIGNVYKSELLFLRALDPLAPVASVADDDLVACYETARAIMAPNLRPGPRQTRGVRPRQGFGQYRGEEPTLWVYGRNGGRCLLCGGAIALRNLGRNNRSTYSCGLVNQCCASTDPNQSAAPPAE